MTEPTKGMRLEPNEGDWLTGLMPSVMIHYLAKLATDRRIDFHFSVKTTERKLRLFYCGCARRVWHLLRVTESQGAIEVCERYADGEAKKNEVRTALHCAEAAIKREWPTWAIPREDWGMHQASNLPILALNVSLNNIRERLAQGGEPVEQQEQVGMLRDLFANPFRPSSSEADWLTPTVVQLACAAYESRQLPTGTLDNLRLAVLGDALEDAGCTNAEILDHLRGSGLHVRGCWALDLLLSKT